MFAFFWYQFTFVLSIVIYIPLKVLGIGYADMIVTIAYFLTSVNFIFTNEAIPDKHLEVPSIHHYFRSHNSRYGYMMAGFFFVSAILYVFLSSNIQQIPDGVFVLILWAIMISIVYGYRFYTGNGQLFVENVVLDYIKQNIPTKPKNLEGIVNAIIYKDNEGKLTPEEMAQFVESKYSRDLNPGLALQIVDTYYRYWEDASEPLISDEVAAANQISEAEAQQIKFEQIQTAREQAANRARQAAAGQLVQMPNQPQVQPNPVQSPNPAQPAQRQPLAGQIKK